MRGGFFIFVVLILLLLAFPTDVNPLSLVKSLPISSNETIVSLGDVFELGFFRTTASSGDGDRWYLGIWYKSIPERTYVWVANRDKPLSNSNGILKMSSSNLVLLDDSDILVWSTNLTGAVRSPVTAELLGNGNFVLRDPKTNDEDGILWQSFDFPTDTLLPGMKMGWNLKTGHNKFLTSWKSQYDPSSGVFSYKLQHRELSEFYLLNGNVPVQRSGPWDGIGFNGIPEMQQWKVASIVFNFVESSEEVAFTFGVTDPNIYARLTMSYSGDLQLSTLIPTDERWNIFWASSKASCDSNLYCGPYTYCDTNMLPNCRCIEGFKPRDSESDLTSGCVRKTPLNCVGNDFLWLRNMKLPDTKSAIVDRTIGLKECKEKCLKECNCTAYANSDIRDNGSGCVIWLGKIEDVRNFVVGGQDLYVKVAAADLDHKSNRTGKTIGLIVGISVLLLLCLIVFCIWKRKRKRLTQTLRANVNQDRDPDGLMEQLLLPEDLNLFQDNITEPSELPSTDYGLLVRATNNFSTSNKLGEGGFGSVYKGKSLNGVEIAVKRLSDLSHQGNDEFEVEVKIISRLQHINLVRIVGCCAHQREKLLIYEYLENSSLDRHLFDTTRSYKLNWQKRFDIINGIVKGVVYLHHESRTKVIHRDLKVSNILLDKNMVPKISDFGMARIFLQDEHEAVTQRIVGTYGYMSPEYAMDGIYSEKSDVFSFGVMLLEIITGKRNRGFISSGVDSHLFGYVWRNIEEGTEIEVADPNIVDSSSPSPTFQPDEVLRCIKIAILCVQDYANNRPLMLSVASMLGKKTEEIPKGYRPNFCYATAADTDSDEEESSSAASEPWTSGNTKSGVDAR